LTLCNKGTALQAAEKLNCLLAITAICLGFAYQ